MFIFFVKISGGGGEIDREWRVRSLIINLLNLFAEFINFLTNNYLHTIAPPLTKSWLRTCMNTDYIFRITKPLHGEDMSFRYAPVNALCLSTKAYIFKSNWNFCV